ncbi:general secretion pathway protein GspJ [Pseudomonas syringae]|uniref:General secretion pathway protein GspJ n=1 Tax=Pseudomonas syringae TaxID=317 RepID=A0A1C7Z0S1_PSESX|nr:prepilin-type N-terminal cleavage/methylation domain-containing protein [Pseudomonas syringae]OCR22098.1 general secretion pathway protein GspJ [Pseudomonas syringae]
MRRLSRGFTLLEMLLALVLLGVLTALVAGALLGANRALLKGERYSQRLDELRATQNFLHKALQGALPLEIQAAGDDRAVIFEGQPQRLRFAAGLDSVLGGGIQLHTFEVVGSGKGNALQVRFEHLQSAGGGAWGQPQVLLHGVRDVRFSYRGRDTRGVRTGWLQTWPWPARLPEAIRINLNSDGPVAWFPQVVALRLELSDLQVAP